MRDRPPLTYAGHRIFFRLVRRVRPVPVLEPIARPWRPFFPSGLLEILVPTLPIRGGIHDRSRPNGRKAKAEPAIFTTVKRGDLSEKKRNPDRFLPPGIRPRGSATQEFSALRNRTLYNAVSIFEQKTAGSRMTRNRMMTKGSVLSMQGASPSTSLSLLQLARENDQGAWDRIIYLYTPLMHRWCRASGLQDADMFDVGQEVFRSVFKNLAGFRKEKPQHSFRRWLKTMTRRKVIDHIRLAQRCPEPFGGSNVQDVADGLVHVEEDDSPAEMDTENKILLRRAMEMVRLEFEVNTWEAFWRTTIDGHAPDDVARSLGVTRNSVYLSRSRVLGRLKAQFAELIEEAFKDHS
jgi:RNA polymerase sigma-70 factor, ECF subfamily